MVKRPHPYATRHLYLSRSHLEQRQLAQPKPDRRDLAREPAPKQPAVRDRVGVCVCVCLFAETGRADFEPTAVRFRAGSGVETTPRGASEEWACGVSSPPPRPERAHVFFGEGGYPYARIMML